MSKITNIVPRRHLHDVDPEIGQIIIQGVRGITWKKAIMGTLGLVGGLGIAYLLIALGLGL